MSLAMATPAQQTDPVQYEDFDPKTEWKEEAEANILLLYLPDFLKEQIRISVELSREIRVFGQRPIITDHNKWSRFNKSFTIPENCDVNKIVGRFQDGVLTITLPKVTITPSPIPSEPASTRNIDKEENEKKQYEDFDPTAEWKEEAEANILLLYLPGFIKKQIRIMYSESSREIIVLGERPITTDHNKWSRFNKSFTIPENCDVEKIASSFQNGVLTITLPKVTITPSSKASEPASTSNIDKEENEKRQYEVFDPKTESEWKEEAEANILLLYLPGFRKDQVRVQVTARQDLIVKGERLITDNKWIRFEKRFPIPQNCEVMNITAKFEGGILYIKMPKITIPSTTSDNIDKEDNQNDQKKKADEEKHIRKQNFWESYVNHDENCVGWDEIRKAMDDRGSSIPGLMAYLGIFHADSNGDDKVDFNELDELINFMENSPFSIQDKKSK